MGQITLQKFKRYKIVSALPEPEVYLEGEQIFNDVSIKVKLDFNESKRFLPKDGIIRLYPITKQGVAMLPFNLGTVDNIEIDEKGYKIEREAKENLYFNLKISDPKAIVKGYAYRLKFKKNTQEGLIEDEESGQKSILPIIENPNQTIPFRVDMQHMAGSPPTLFVATGMKNKIKNSAITQYNVTTAAIREIVSNYILDKDLFNDLNREKWELLIENLKGEKNYKFPNRNDALSNSGILNDEVKDDIETIIVEFGYRRKFKGTNVTLIDAFKNELLLTNGENEDEEDEDASSSIHWGW